jgi:orotidine-5'-phosphate decarboxylase
MTNPVFVALDTTDPVQARTLAEQVRDHVGGLKLGLEYFCANGPDGVCAFANLGLPIFLDLKLHDIPNTVAGAMRALHRIAPAIVTVHAAGGQAMMEAAKAAAPDGTRVIGVTVMTSLDDSDLAAAGVSGGSAGQVERLARLTRSAGLDGIVCSGREVAAARQTWPEGFFVVPGVRPAQGDLGDQKRVITPADAVESGASVLVIGRPISQAADPASAARDIAASLFSPSLQASG